MMLVKRIFQVFKIIGLITLGAADIAVAGHVLHRPQVLFFQPFRYHALPDLHSVFILRVDFSQSIVEV